MFYNAKENDVQISAGNLIYVFLDGSRWTSRKECKLNNESLLSLRALGEILMFAGFFISLCTPCMSMV